MADMLERWRVSLDLHLQYVDLDDAAYRQVQSWPAHDRPTRWILELARQKLLELKAHCEAREALGDAKFAEALEAANFLSTLVGLQNVKRFIPLADPQVGKSAVQPARPASSASSTSTVQMRTPKNRPAADGEATREMPRIKPATAASKPKAAEPTARQTRPGEQKKPAAKPAEPKSASAAKTPAAELEDKVLDDAQRLLKWGRQWHELPELIARIADRPPLAEVRRLLRTHKADIEAQAKRGK